MKLAIIIVFYNTKPIESAIIRSIMAADLTGLDSVELYLWNNGPKEFSPTTIKQLTELLHAKKITATLYNATHNFSLATIYNFFISQKGFTHYIIFDQDTVLKYNFFSKLACALPNDIILPHIIERISQQIVCPEGRNKSGRYAPELTSGVIESKELYSVTSGMCLSKYFLTSFKNQWGFVFHEAFALYSVDIMFFRMLDVFLQQHPQFSIHIFNSILHSLSEYEEKEKKVYSRRQERTYSECLLRIHSRRKSRFSALNYFIRKRLGSGTNFKNIINTLKTIATKRHPRCNEKYSIAFREIVRHPIRLS